MPKLRQLLTWIAIACAVAPALGIRSVPPSPQSTGAPAADLARERTWIDESNAARDAGDHATALRKAVDAVKSLLARQQSEQDAAWLSALEDAGAAAYELKDRETARAAWQRVYDVRAATLADDHVDLQTARQNLALALSQFGDFPGARALLEKALELSARTLPDDHVDMQRIRINLSSMLFQLGDFAAARDQFEKVLEVAVRTLPDGDRMLLAVRQNLAMTYTKLGDLPRAHALLVESLESLSRAVPSDHLDLQIARENLAVSCFQRGDAAGARELLEQVVDVYTRTFPDDHPVLSKARQNLAGALGELGDLAGARVVLEKVLEVNSRTLSADDPEFVRTQENLATALYLLGDLSGARVLQERVLAARERALPDDHLDLARSRQALAAAIKDLGDLAGARALEERVLEVRSRSLPDDHLELQAARQNLAVTLRRLGDFATARALTEKAVEVYASTLPEDHIKLARARIVLASMAHSLGDFDSARELSEQALETCARTLSDGNPDLRTARMNVAMSMRELGDLEGARRLFERVLEVDTRALPDSHPDLQFVRENLAGTIAAAVAGGGLDSNDGRTRCVDLIGALCRADVGAARSAIFASSAREAEERCAGLAKRLDVCVSFAQGFGVFEPLAEFVEPSFELAETTRAAGIASAEFARSASGSAEYGELRGALREASDRLAALARKGTTSEEFDRARAECESLERELLAIGERDGGGDLDVESLAAHLPNDAAAVGFRTFTKRRIEPGQETAVESLCAFVVRSATLTYVDLGPIEPIESAVRAWRGALGVAGDGRGVSPGAREGQAANAHAQGVLLREKIFDPLVPAFGGARRVVVAVDHVLHVVPIDALPLDEESLVGDRWSIETRATLVELVSPHAPLAETGELVAFGEIDYGSGGASIAMLRGGAWESGFAALHGTSTEVRGIERCFTERFGDEAPRSVCRQSGATRERLFALASGARYLHVATHGWFAPESIPSWNDPEPVDRRTGLGLRQSGADQVKRMSPMLLCGVALAGANLPDDAVGRGPGRITALEISTLDLSHCDLAVLSACDTNVGERRAGQGVASLQKALQIAGARSVITSLWKVPDEATSELMTDFYRRLWVEKKPKAQALWEAKKRLRDGPTYTVRDWAAWVLTGEPD